MVDVCFAIRFRASLLLGPSTRWYHAHVLRDSGGSAKSKEFKEIKEIKRVHTTYRGVQRHLMSRGAPHF